MLLRSLACPKIYVLQVLFYRARIRLCLSSLSHVSGHTPVYTTLSRTDVGNVFFRPEGFDFHGLAVYPETHHGRAGGSSKLIMNGARGASIIREPDQSQKEGPLSISLLKFSIHHSKRHQVYDDI